MLAFDLDGVFLPDIVFDRDTFEMVHAVRTQWMKPLFIPPMPYYLITGRPPHDHAGTLNWIEKFGMCPLRLFHDNPDVEAPARYKEAVLRSHPEVSRYIESDPEQVAYLRTQVPACHIEWFHDIINAGLAHGALP